MDIQKLTKEQAVVISGFTGILCGEFSDFHTDVEKRLGRGVQTFEFGSKEFAAEVKKLYEADFIGMGTVDTEAAKAQAVPEWISVEDKLPETEPNTDGVVCAVVCSLGNVYRARYMHDVDIGVDTKYWSEFAVNYNGREYEHYEINAKISHWMPLPDAPQEPAND
ncbi:DUF551 domain-containing protein [Acinetobacter lwoffii]|uniref:DUF551 domain-containing protein n=1 Tax=Acinetobacter lwoffii TaxID=28090 RepID=UPI00168CBA35|nr:DUF551 domain-containing protein [Acinetobacter lwoffii]